MASGVSEPAAWRFPPDLTLGSWACVCLQSALEVYKEMVLLYLEEGRRLINARCAALEPWQIIGASVFTTLGAVWLRGFLFQQESNLSHGLHHTNLQLSVSVEGLNPFWSFLFSGTVLAAFGVVLFFAVVFIAASVPVLSYLLHAISELEN